MFLCRAAHSLACLRAAACGEALPSTKAFRPWEWPRHRKGLIVFASGSRDAHESRRPPSKSFDWDDIALAPAQRHHAHPCQRHEPNEEERRAYAKVLSLLDYRAYTRYELLRRLKDKGFGVGAAEYAVARAVDVGAQCDVDYARSFAAARWRRSRWAPRRIGAALRQRGVDDGDVANALEWLEDEGHMLEVRVSDFDFNFDKEADDGFGDATTGFDVTDGPEPRGPASGRGMMRRQLFQAAERRDEALRRYDRATRRRRLASWMQRNGHDWDMIRAVLEHLSL